MQLKLRQILLFVFACAILIYTGLPGGSLIAMGALMQLALLIHNIELSSRSQFAALKLYLLSIPIFLFWGGVQSFTLIYFKEAQYLFWFMSLTIVFILSFILCLQVVFSYKFLKANHYNSITTLQDTFNNMKNEKADFFKYSLILFICTFVPWLDTDWKLIFALMATHLSLNPSQSKKAFLIS